MHPGHNEIPCDALLKVLANKTRLAIVRQLMQASKSVGELNMDLQSEQSLLSHHLQVLRRVGIVEAVREGKRVRYRIRQPLTVGQRTNVLNLGCCRLEFD